MEIERKSDSECPPPYDQYTQAKRKYDTASLEMTLRSRYVSEYEPKMRRFGAIACVGVLASAVQVASLFMPNSQLEDILSRGSLSVCAAAAAAGLAKKRTLGSYDHYVMLKSKSSEAYQKYFRAERELNEIVRKLQTGGQ